MPNEFNAIDENGLHRLTKKQVAQQTAYLDSLPKIEQIKLAANACDMTVTEFLMEVAKLHGEMINIEENMIDETTALSRNGVEVKIEYVEPDTK